MSAHVYPSCLMLSECVRVGSLLAKLRVPAHTNSFSSKTTELLTDLSYMYMMYVVRTPEGRKLSGGACLLVYLHRYKVNVF